MIVLLGSCKTENKIEDWVKQSKEDRPDLHSFEFAYKPLSQEETTHAIELLYPLWMEDEKSSTSQWWSEKLLQSDSLKMLFDFKRFGDIPLDGRSLYLSLHGGGNTTHEKNDQQWSNQIGLYSPQEGIYLAPRAPWNDWDMWFKPGIDQLYEDIIRAAIANEGVNPNKVYLLGYSAGGDGLYRMAPRMADRWAAASMMAGHPGDASQVNLRNLPFMIWMGEEDAAYDRNKWAVVCGERLDSLQKADPLGYIHETHIIKEKGHWMDRADTAAIQWMAKYERNPYPEKIVWKQDKVTLPSFYWLSVSMNEAEKDMEAIVSRKDNTITIEKNDYNDLTIYLNDDMFDLDQPIDVIYEGNSIYKGKVERKLINVVDSWENRKDRNYLFPAKLLVKNNSVVN